MSEKEKQTNTGIAEAINILQEVRGPEFVEGLISDINIGTAQIAEAENSPADAGL